jgi:hypothetical protein
MKLTFFFQSCLVKDENFRVQAIFFSVIVWLNILKLEIVADDFIMLC